MKKLAVITGASSGIGKEISISFSKESYVCILLGRSEDQLKSTKNLCESSDYYILDLQNPLSIQSTAHKILNDYESSHYDHIVLINNAGMIEKSSFEKSSIESWQKQFQVNLLGPVLWTQQLLPLLFNVSSARIINISSTLGLRPIPETSAYSATKAAMNSWTQSLALELAPRNIPVNALCPGLVETPIHDFYKTQNSHLRETLDQLQPVGRMGQPHDIVKAVFFLSEISSPWLTGALLPVDGGILLKT